MFPLMIRKEDIASIHEKTLWLLEHIGIIFDHDDARELFRRHGARVDGKRVFIDGKLAEKAVKGFIPQFKIRGLQSEAVIGNGETVFSAISGVTEIQKGLETRPINLEDYLDIQKLHQTSDVIGICAVNICDLPDLDQEHHDAKRTAYTLLHTDKPIVGLCGNGKTAETSIKIAKDFYAYEGNYIMGVVSVHSPLEYTGDDLEAIFAYAEERQPICLTSCSMTGLSSPITIEGTVLQNNAEVLAGLIFAQLLSPGLPIVYGNLSMGFDMRYGCPTSGMETAAIIAYAKRMAEFYHIPCRAGGGLNDAKLIDYQAAQETALNLAATIDYQVDFVYQAFGALNDLMQFSPEKFVLDEEMVKSILWLKHREPGKIALDLQDIESNFKSGNFLKSKETVKKFKKESFLPLSMNKGGREAWLKKGMPEITENAAQVVAARLKNYQEPSMSPEQKKYLTDIIGK